MYLFLCVYVEARGQLQCYDKWKMRLGIQSRLGQVQCAFNLPRDLIKMHLLIHCL